MESWGMLITFSYDVSNINGNVGEVSAIVILQGSGCLPNEKVVATVKDVNSATTAYYSRGLSAGDYSAVALLTVLESNGHYYYAQSNCANFTVAIPVPEFSSPILMLATTLLLLGLIRVKRRTGQSFQTNRKAVAP